MYVVAAMLLLVGTLVAVSRGNKFSASIQGNCIDNLNKAKTKFTQPNTCDLQQIFTQIYTSRQYY